MRIRSIKPEFWMHEGLCKCSEFTRLLAIALLNWADDEGYFMANPVLIRGQVFPFLDDSKTIPRSLQDLSRVGWITLGKDDQGRDVGRVINFIKHQRVDKPKPSTIKESWQFQDESKTNPRMIQDASKEEGKGREGNREGKEDVPCGDSPSDIFDLWNSSNTPKTIQARTPERVKSARARLADNFFRDNWRQGIEIITKCPFLMGQNDKGWCADIDWFLSPKTLPKIIEGKYSNSPQLNSKGFTPLFPGHRPDK